MNMAPVRFRFGAGGSCCAFVANVSGRPVPLGVCNPEEGVIHHDQTTQRDTQKARTTDLGQSLVALPIPPDGKWTPLSSRTRLAQLTYVWCNSSFVSYMLDGTCPTVLSTSFRIMAAVHGSEGKRTMFSEQHTTRNDSYLILLLELDSSERSNAVCSAPFSVLFWDRSRLSALADTGRHRPVLWFSRQNSTIASCFPGGVSSLKTRMDIRNSVDGTEPPTSTYVSFYCTRFRCEGEHLFPSHPLSCLSTSRKEVKRSRRRSASHTPL